MRMIMAASLVLLAIMLGGSTPVLGQELVQIPDDAPDSYVDDVYHCFDPSGDQNLVSCDSTTFRWSTDELTPDPPMVCVQDWDAEDDLLVVTSGIINGEIIEVDDQLEPCVLWAMKYILSGSLPTDAPSRNGTGWNITDDDTFLPPDDLYHCKNPNSTSQNTVSISCDPSTYLWALEELLPEQPPTMCGGPDFVISGDDLSNIQDWFEPCVHWAMIYGNLAPATPVPTDAVETDLSNTAVLDPIILTLNWPKGVLAPPLNIDRDELQLVTERHLMEQLMAQLGNTVVTSVEIIMSPDVTASETSGTSWTEVLTGTVTLREDSGVEPATVRKLVLEALQGEALQMYRFRLNISNDFALRLVESVQVRSVTDSSSDRGTDNNDGIKWDDKLLIIVSSSGAGGLLVICCLGYCLFVYATRRVEAKAQAAVMAATAGKNHVPSNASYKSSVASSSKPSRVSIQNLPLVHGTAKALGQPPPHHNDDAASSDEENQMSLISMSAFGDDENPKYQPYHLSHHRPTSNYLQDETDDEQEGQEVMYGRDQNKNVNLPTGAHFDADEDHHSVGTSVYSYFNQDNQSLATNDDTFLGSMIGKRGGLYDDESTLGYPSTSPLASRKPGFSVLDTLSKYSTSPTTSEKKSPLEALMSHSTTNRKSKIDVSPKNTKKMTEGRNIVKKDQKTPIATTKRQPILTDMNMDDTNMDDDDHAQYRFDDVQDPLRHTTMDETNDDALTSQTDQITYSVFLESMDDVEDSASEIGTIASFMDHAAVPPVKERMEKMWAQEDSDKPRQNQRDLKEQQHLQPKDEDEEKKETKSIDTKNRRFKVFQDDGSGRHSGSGDADGRNISLESDGSPAASILQPPDALLALTATPMKMIDIVTDDTFDGDDDNDMAFRLPNQLKATDANNDNMSQSSSLSSRSGRSNRSAVALKNNTYGAASIRAQADALLQRQQKGSGEEDSVKSSDSAMYRSLLGQGDMNDAGLFGKTSATKASKTSECASTGSSGSRRIPSSVRPKPHLSNLIQSFDEVWSRDKSIGVEQPVPSDQKSSENNSADSDEDDVYLEGNDDEDEEPAQSDNDSVKSGASRVVQQLSSLLAAPMMMLSVPTTKQDNDPSPTKVMDVPNELFDVETKRSFEIEDPEEESDHDTSGEDNLDAVEIAVNMARLGKLSSGGYVDTMASF